MSPVAAHAAFIDSNPVDGSVLAESPTVAELRFTEPILLTASKVQLLHLGPGTREDLPLSTAHGGTTLLAEMPKLERGAYILRYVVVDPADLHKTVGSISFGIGVAAPPSESGEQVDSSWLSIALRVITDGALLLTVGAVVVAVLLVRNGRRDLEHVTDLAVSSSAVIAVGWVGLLVADAATVGFQNVKWGSLLLNSDPGRHALVGVQLALGLWWTARLLHRGGNHAAQWFVVRIMAGDRRRVRRRRCLWWPRRDRRLLPRRGPCSGRAPRLVVHMDRRGGGDVVAQQTRPPPAWLCGRRSARWRRSAWRQLVPAACC